MLHYYKELVSFKVQRKKDFTTKTTNSGSLSDLTALDK
jgi:hypothetical protein